MIIITVMVYDEEIEQFKRDLREVESVVGRRSLLMTKLKEGLREAEEDGDMGADAPVTTNKR